MRIQRKTQGGLRGRSGRPGELGRVAGWLRKVLALTAAKEWELSEMTAPVEVCSCILCDVGCTDSLVKKIKKEEKGWEE